MRQSAIFQCNPLQCNVNVQCSEHGTGLLSPKQSGMDRPSTSACLKGKAAKDKQKQKKTVHISSVKQSLKAKMKKSYFLKTT